MALQRRHSDPASKPFDPEKEFSTNQRKRYTETANKAAERREQRELYKAAQDPTKARAALTKAKNVLTTPIGKQPAPGKKKTFLYMSHGFWRVLLWSIVLGAFWLWVQFMFPSS